MNQSSLLNYAVRLKRRIAHDKEQRTIEVWHRVCGALPSRVYAILDDMLVELAIFDFNELHSTTVRHAPDCGTNYGTKQVAKS